MSERLAGVKPVLQPHPVRNPGGDCFACATQALLAHLFPEREITFDQAYRYWQQESGVPCNHWTGTREAFYNAKRDFNIEIRLDYTPAYADPEHFSGAWGGWIPRGSWNERLEGWIAAGWLAVAEIVLAGGGPLDSQGRHNAQDHFVVLDGARQHWRQLDGGRAMKDHQTHVVCSARGAYWIDTHDLLMKHGAGALWLIRRED